MITEGALMTTVHLLAVDALRLRLLRGARLWSDNVKETHVLVHVTTGTTIKATDRLLG